MRRPLPPWLPYAVVALVVAMQAVFFAVDGRLPRDPARLVYATPGLVHDLGAHPGETILAALGTEGGWYPLLLAAALRVHRAAWVMEAVQVGWLVLVLVATAGLARRLGGDRAALAATLVAAGSPALLILSRHAWIHLPEAALMLTMAWLWAADPRLRRWGTVIALALAGVLIARLRPSGLVGLGIFAAALLVPGEGGVRRRPWTRVAPLLVLWVGVGAWVISGLGNYLAVKGPPGLFHHEPLRWSALQTLGAVGPLGAVAVALGLGALVPRWRRALAPDDLRPVRALVALWALAPPLLMTRYHAGSADFTWLAPVLAVAAGAGLARLYPATLPAAAAPLALALVVPWTGWHPLVAAWSPGAQPAASDLRIARPDWSGPVTEALEATCAGRGWLACHVVAPAGLYTPLRSEDFGYLELFLAGEDRVQLRALGDRPQGGWARWGVHAMAVWHCDRAEHLEWLTHYPDLMRHTADLAEDLELRPARSVEIGRCTWHWLVPDAPAGASTWDAAAYRDLNEQLLLQRPDRRGFTHLPRAMPRREPAGGWDPPARR